MPSMNSTQSTSMRLHAGCCLCTPQDGCSVEKRMRPSRGTIGRACTPVTLAIPQSSGIMPVVAQVLHRCCSTA
eukprot:1744478-Amphidinium_carterae.1